MGGKELAMLAQKVKNYGEVKEMVEKSMSEREKVVNCRGREVVPRKYHLSEHQLAELSQRKALYGVANPYQKGAYWASVEALIVLGPNQWHNFEAVKATIQVVMSQKTNAKGDNLWDVFANRSPRSANGKDLDGRITQNYRVLQRLGGLSPFGEKLRQLCSCIDMKKESEKLYLRLNTNFSAPDEVRPLKISKKNKSITEAD